ncbi:MAG: hypothetical protein SNJ71_06205 [Bacteroidales bacterium]
MKQIKIIFLLVTLVGFSTYAQDIDSLIFKDLQEVGVTAKRGKSANEAIKPHEVIDHKYAQQTIAHYETQKVQLERQIDSYQKFISGAKSEDIILKTTGSFRPTIALGYGDLYDKTKDFIINVSSEIQKIKDSELIDTKSRLEYINKLELMKGYVRMKTEKLSLVMAKKLRT